MIPTARVCNLLMTCAQSLGPFLRHIVQPYRLMIGSPLSGSIVSPHVHSHISRPRLCAYLASDRRGTRSRCVSHAHRLFSFSMSRTGTYRQTRINRSPLMVDDSPKTYRLSAAIYHDGNHWTSRWITSDGHVWGHDGQKHKGGLKSEGKMVEPCGRSKYSDILLAHTFHSYLRSQSLG